VSLAGLPASASIPEGRVDMRRLDATTEEDIVKQQRADDKEAMKDAARYIYPASEKATGFKSDGILAQD